ncbi:hypothetical protein [Paracoccus sp. (in: a-proteobacteria)]|uniref:hypothetical protein n=1 Tax=Paracoccus sp. TaxID=267 RepID=UPI0026E0B544|nr:hypothetical protein [Paracoccus sp. (in: a-proteobacteria)]MDO5647368.1 hypothetical protein [Paracoccus sp. (in: a-proteobacteria)]
MKQPTEQEILLWAADLRRMMKSPAFEFAVGALRQDYQNRFFGSGCADRDAREVAYRSNQALTDLLSSMETVVIAAETMTRD